MLSATMLSFAYVSRTEPLASFAARLRRIYEIVRRDVKAIRPGPCWPGCWLVGRVPPLESARIEKRIEDA